MQRRQDANRRLLEGVGIQGGAQFAVFALTEALLHSKLVDEAWRMRDAAQSGAIPLLLFNWKTTSEACLL